MLPELAEWGVRAFDRLTSCELYLDGPALRGDEVSDHPDLVRAKLTGRLILAPHDRLVAVRAAYAEAAAQ
jgi:hypothetical protein